MLPTPPPAIAEAGLRALKTVALVDGEVHPLERDLLESLQRFVLGTQLDVDALTPIEPGELAAAIPEGPFRTRIVEGCIFMTLVDGEAGAAEVKLVDAFADALGVEDRSQQTLHRYVDGSLRLLRFDLLRRFIAADRLKHEWQERGLRGLWRLALTAMRGGDPALAARYDALQELPDGTLGREYHRFIRANEFSLPGEPGSPPEVMVFHDCTHVLTGYGTSPVEETQIAAFHAGNRGHDKFGVMMFLLMQFHLGVRITPVTDGLEGVVVPHLVLDAFERGTHLTRDLSTSWEPQLDFERSVDEIRREFNIPARRSQPVA